MNHIAPGTTAPGTLHHLRTVPLTGTGGMYFVPIPDRRHTGDRRAVERGGRRITSGIDSPRQTAASSRSCDN